MKMVPIAYGKPFKSGERFGFFYGTLKSPKLQEIQKSFLNFINK